MKKYDDASWHFEGDYPKDLPQEKAAIHIGMFLKWCIEMGLISQDLKEEEEENLLKVIANQMTGAEFLWSLLDGKLVSEDLNALGNQFALAYYEDDTKFSKAFSDYINDFCDVFNKKAEENGFEYESLYHVEDTLENYLLMEKVIDTRFEQWKNNLAD